MPTQPLTHDQVAILEAKFNENPKPCTEEKKAVAQQIGLSLQRVVVRIHRTACPE